VSQPKARRGHRVKKAVISYKNIVLGDAAFKKVELMPQIITDGVNWYKFKSVKYKSENSCVRMVEINKGAV